MRIIRTLLLSVIVLQTPSDLDATLMRLDAYILAYEPKLSELIADETFVQEVNLPREQLYWPREARSPGPSRVRRSIKSEVAFVALPDNAGWLGFRHVTSVDGRVVRDGKTSLIAALQTNGYDAARALLDASAEYNLGLPRTTNLPNLPLELLRERNRKRFDVRLDSREKIQSTNTLRVSLVEQLTPTLIRNPVSNADMPSVVRAWINDRTGELLRAEVKTFASLAAKEPENAIVVDFEVNKALGMLLPIRMRETFPVERPRLGTGVANYSNFRRFQTSARIIPQ
ncbi:MAG: hypothetical protein K2Y23_00400 [Cyanobacteria bacterium]|nr:hypothetical protein [Cyanobacteriota bacterium]